MWRCNVEVQCESQSCKSSKMRQVGGFSISSAVEESFEEQIQHQFRESGNYGFCDFKIGENPCGNPKIIAKAGFMSSLPWMVPIDCTRIQNPIETWEKLPKTIILYGKSFVLTGLTIHENHRNHFTAIVRWQNVPFTYDGMRSEKLQYLKENNKSLMKMFCGHDIYVQN